MATTAQSAKVNDLRQLVLNQLHEQRETQKADISVVEDHGVVTLSGSVDDKATKLAAEETAKQVRGVRAIANDLIVKAASDRTNTEIAADVMRALHSNILISAENIQAIVRDGCVILEGCVHQELQKMLAEAQVKRLRGIFGISNLLQVKANAPAFEDDENGPSAGSPNGSAWMEFGEAEAG